MLTKETSALAPATVKEITGDRLRLLRGEEEVWARLALSYPYRPTKGDEVLTIGEEEVYVIGILVGRGETVLHTPGDLHLKSDGRVKIEGGEGIDLTAPDMTIRADRIETIARDVFEKLVNSYRWVKEVVRTHAGRERKIIKGSSTLHAERIVETADKDVTIDGNRINLG
jgi:hypothetical protein